MSLVPFLGPLLYINHLEHPYTGKHTKRWYPSNLTPLYAGCDHLEIDLNKTVAYVEKMTSGHPGGVPTSLNHTHQQWDKPNSWPPLVDIVVTAMDNVGKF